MNPQTEDGYTRIANELFDALAGFRIPGEARQVLDCIMRKTYGFNKKEDRIAISQIAEMTNMKKQNVFRALSKLITHRLVIQSDYKLSLNKNYQKWLSFKTSSKVITGKKNKSVIQSDTTVIQSDYKTSSKVMNTKDNKDNIQKTVLPTSGNVIQSDKEIKPYTRKPVEKQTSLQRICYFLEDELQTSIVNWGKQAKALSMMEKAGYTEEQIKKTILYMAKQDDFFQDKGFDLMTVANNIGLYKARARKEMGSHV
jgi:phage replication O-like protein O